MKRFFTRLNLFSFAALFFSCLTCHAATIDLSGSWQFELDPDNTGLKDSWYKKALSDKVVLPGTTDENGKGVLNENAHVDRLSRVWYWKGAAWYQREVDIPESWDGKRITLFLERTKHCQLWVNGNYGGWDNTLSAPHIHDVSALLRPGKNTITLLVDNSRLPPVGPSHQVDERTQTNWNGVVGKIELRATDPVWIESAQVYPNVAKGEATVRLLIGSTLDAKAVGQLKIKAQSWNVDTPEEFTSMTFPIEAKGEQTELELVYKPDAALPLWDEFNPAMVKLSLELDTRVGKSEFKHEHIVNFGMRDFSAERNLFKVNGSVVFLRGRLDCANYPLTGYAPMSKAEWKRIYGILKVWGLNHVRFHSWCPPLAAFEAADEMGFYLQAELPNKRSGFNAPENEEAAYYNIDRLDLKSTETEVSLYDYGKREGELILEHFGNHPSFVMFTLGNELGRNKGMFELVAHFKELDSRKLYAQGANNMHWRPSLAEGDDFWVIGKVGDDRLPIRGSFYIHDYKYGAVDTFPPGTLDDFSNSIRGVPVPLVGHETGQYQVSPDYRDIPKFTGVLRARNYEIFRDRIEEAGMLDQADDFVRASGALAAICYREDIELALRTPGFGGFQLLDIMDFPGQSTALVGMLNVFMESKGLLSAEEWREFCSEVVPLLRIKKHSWTRDEVLMGRIQVAHYGPEDLDDAIISLGLTDAKGKTLASHRFEALDLARGQLNEVDLFAWPLELIQTPQRLDLTIRIEGTPYQNSYPIWVYPTSVEPQPDESVLVARSLYSAKTKAHLAGGGRVLLLPPLDQLPKSVGGGFQTEFWSPMFAKGARKRGQEEPPGTLGHICNPAHPALAYFPTEFHSNWQWWHLVKNSRPVILDDAPQNYRPIVQPIDNFDRNHKLGLIFETKVGKGSVLVCAIDLPAIQDQPEGRQMLHSLLEYVKSDAFQPEHEFSPEMLKAMLP
ncbi:MAG: sugar-binding domain-containing protein [Opitutales bacterium]